MAYWWWTILLGVPEGAQLDGYGRGQGERFPRWDIRRAAEKCIVEGLLEQGDCGSSGRRLGPRGWLESLVS